MRTSGNSRAGGAESGERFKTLRDVPHDYRLVTTPEQARELAAVLEAAPRFAFDTETTSTDSRTADLVGISFATEPGRAWYVAVPRERQCGDDLFSFEPGGEADCNTYPEKKEFSVDYDKKITEVQKAGGNTSALENARLSEKLEYTISGRVGKTLEPFFAPIGFDWKITTATIGALAAKEVFVAQMGILYAEGEADEESEGLRQKLVKHYTPLQAFCIMLFCLLSIPCLATLAIIKRELNSWKMAFVEAGALFALAYTATLIVYQLGTLLKIGTKML